VKIIRRVFSRKEEPPTGPAPISSLSSELTSSDIENYYFRMVNDCLRRFLIPADAVRVEVRREGLGPQGFPAYATLVRLLRWDPVVSPVLLQNAPVVEARVRKSAAASVVLKHTHFAGMWIHASSELDGAPQVYAGLPAALHPGS
jgi:hypothetical protein